jgi:hypothetical protein
MKDTMWTERRFIGLALMLGCVLFLTGASLPVTDSKGTFIYQLPPQQWLGVVFTHPTLWWWVNVLFLGGTLVAPLGFARLTALLQGAGDRVFSYLGLIALVFGAVLWVIQLAFRLSIDFWEAQETARTGVMPDVYVPLIRWIDALFVMYTILTFLAASAYGGALISTRMLPRWLGWVIILYSLAGLGLLAIARDVPPLLHYLLPIVIGILLLQRRYQPPTASLRESASVGASTTAGTRRRKRCWIAISAAPARETPHLLHICFERSWWILPYKEKRRRGL